MIKIFKCLSLILFMLAFISIGFMACGSSTYAGSSNSNKNHLLFCEWAKKINLGNLVQFTSMKHAESKAYQPCKVLRL